MGAEWLWFIVVLASRLVDIENTLVGLPSVYRTHLLELRKIHVSSFTW